MPGEQGGSSPEPGMRRLFLLRHGEAAPADGDPWLAALTPRGRAQIETLAEALAGCGLDLLVSSAVPRAIETAAILARRTGLAPVVEPGLNELQPGAVLAGAPEAVRGAIRQAYREAGEPGARFLGGEAFCAFAERVGQAMERLLATPGWTRAAIVTHEPALRYVLARCHGLGLAGLGGFEAATGAVTVLDCPRGAGLDAVTLLLANARPDELLRLG
jgi:broad specificity phosphatase PhoE